jgi:hypothetical protein
MGRIFLGLIILVLISGCLQSEPVPQPETQLHEQKTSFEHVGGRYNGSIIITEGMYQNQPYTQYDIIYTKNGRTMRGYFLPQLRPALDWIKGNVPEGSKLFGWWDYGHMIQGYTGRDVVIFSPSEDMLWSVSSGRWDEEASGPMASNEEIKDIAFGLLSSDPKELKSAMEKYGSDYVFVSALDEKIILYWLERFGLKQYIGENRLKERVSELVLFKMLNEQNVEGFEMVYSDALVKVYRLVG